MSVLDHFTDDQLFEELVRRRNSAKSKRQPARWCEQCLNFRTWTGRGEVPDDYNPCAMKHHMEFHTPTAWQSPECYGHYRTICTDRQECPE
ncbi:hypothetical protein SAMN05216588_101224 [Pseudomonas flavescens]|uniref:Uncharacterized protein n=1 Tax=Phytopseudomonas flavescens TaxID=29435 RepID=A0A1G7XPX9_9GAMM|nr:hypothetical protein [Pseudomonas flavescens]SDG86269.1 hypothetical protein SAMN05216588_101224 [Pseudomonas flavescens]